LQPLGGARREKEPAPVVGGWVFRPLGFHAAPGRASFAAKVTAAAIMLTFFGNFGSGCPYGPHNDSLLEKFCCTQVPKPFIGGVSPRPQAALDQVFALLAIAFALRRL
jgi:hypothetical protein